MSKEILIKIKKIFLKTFGLKVKLNTILNKHLDSLDAVELTIEVETEFKIEIADEQVEKCKTVKDIVILIKNAINK